jgi:DNA polymerase
MPWTERQKAMLEAMGIRLPLTVELPAESTVDAAEPVLAEPLREASVALPTAERAPAPVNPRPTRPTAAERAPAPAATAPVLLRDRVTGTEAMDWAALREAVAGCTACKLCEGRTQTVFGVGHARAHWLVVGEAPGEQEDRQGEPFVGKSGQLLDNMLRSLGLTRTVPEGDAAASLDPARQVYIANTVKCRPPFNRNPEPAELAQCEPFLIRQIQLLQPRIILAMGRFAVQSLLRSNEPIGRLRGRVHTYEGVPLVVTYHPAYLLRNPEDKSRAWDDLCLARETLAQR